MDDINVRVEYEPKQIRHMAIQCPYCERWFAMGDALAHGAKYVGYDDEIEFTNYHCPVCDRDFNRDFGRKFHVTECSYPDVYNGIMHKHVMWTEEEEQ